MEWTQDRVRRGSCWRGAALLLALAAAPAFAAAQKTGSSRPGIDVRHYEFRVDFPDKAHPDTITFATIVSFSRTSRVDTLVLDLVSEMQVEEVMVGGRAVTAGREGATVRVPLPSGSGDTLQVSVRYRGVPKDGLVIRRDTIGGYWTAWGDNYPNRARQWLATVDHPSDKATVEWVVRTPPSHRVIANGERVEETPEMSRGSSSRMLLTRWRTSRPLYTAVMVIGVAPFAVYELGETACGFSEQPGCVEQSVWMTPDVRDFMPGPFARAGEIVELYGRLVGPYPYEKLAHVQSQTRWGGMENAAAIFYSD